MCSSMFFDVRFSPCNIVYKVGTKSDSYCVQKIIMALSDTKLRSIHGKPYSGSPEVSDADGLSARNSPKGVITFQYRYRWGGKPHSLSDNEIYYLTSGWEESY